MKEKLLEMLIEKLHLMPDEKKEEGEKPSLESKLEVKKEEKPLIIEGLEEKKNDLDSAEHDHEIGEKCGDECPVKLALKKKLGK